MEWISPASKVNTMLLDISISVKTENTVPVDFDTLKWCWGEHTELPARSSCDSGVYFLLYCSICPNSHLFYTPLNSTLSRDLPLLNIANGD